jgi:hypothetical protein
MSTVEHWPTTGTVVTKDVKTFERKRTKYCI